jgi:hypothetical protein
MAKAKKSAFVSGLASNKEALQKAAETERASLADQSEVQQVYQLNKAGDRVSVPCKLVSVKCATHEDGDKKGLPYVNWVFAPLEAPGKGMLIGNFQPGYNRATLAVDGGALGWIFGEFQACGFDTKSWANDPSEIETAADELDKEKPTIMLSIRAAEIKKGVRAGSVAINYSISRLIEDLDSSQEDTDNSGKEADLGDELDEAMEKEPTPPPATTKVTKTKATKKKALAVGDTVKFNFENEEGEMEEIAATIEEIKGDDLSVNDGNYNYEIKVADVL